MEPYSKGVVSIKKLALLVVILAAAWAAYGYFYGDTAIPPKTEAVKKAGVQKESMNLAVYYVKYTNNDAYLVRETHHVPYSENGPAAAISELVSGVPKTGGAVRVLPPGTRLLGVDIKDSLATVNFSPEVLSANVGSSGEALGIQSIVNTLTEFAQIREVSFQVEGRADGRIRDWWGHVGLYEQPFKRNLDKVYEPAIWVSHPAEGQAAGVPLLVRGSARVFEGAVHARLLDASGRKIAEESTAAPRGTPGRWDFEMKFTFNPPGKGNGVLEVYRAGPKGEPPADTVKIPIQWP